MSRRSTSGRGSRTSDTCKKNAAVVKVQQYHHKKETKLKWNRWRMPRERQNTPWILLIYRSKPRVNPRDLICSRTAKKSISAYSPNRRKWHLTWGRVVVEILDLWNPGPRMNKYRTTAAAENNSTATSVKSLMRFSFISPHVRESIKVLDSGSQSLDSGFRPLDSGFQPSWISMDSGLHTIVDSGFHTIVDSGFHAIVDSGFQWSGFRIPVSGFRITTSNPGCSSVKEIKMRTHTCRHRFEFFLPHGVPSTFYLLIHRFMYIICKPLHNFWDRLLQQKWCLLTETNGISFVLQLARVPIALSVWCEITSSVYWFSHLHLTSVSVCLCLR